MSSSSGAATKGSDEGGAGRMQGTSLSKRAAAAAAGASAFTSTKRTPSETQVPTLPQDKHSSGSSNATTAAASIECSQLKVFGLNPRAHRVRRQVASGHQADREAENQKPTSKSAERRTDNPARSPKETQVEQKQQQLKHANTGPSSAPKDSAQVGATGESQPAVRKQTIRASKYGSFYKPQDLTQQPPQSQAIESRTRVAMTKAADELEQLRPASSRASNQVASDAANATAGKTGGNKSAGSATVRTRSRSPDRPSKQTGRRRSFDEDISTIKTESGPAQCQPKVAAADAAPPGQPILKARTQFNILPPPQLSIATKGTGSVVGYAKSRIYDKPQRLILANPPESTFSALDDQSGQIPASILSGFKPPKQVNVTKAREKWEGGEPFAKCKSRKRLAAQAKKKLFPGTWSMTSVVATQQLHLQQALAQSASSANHRSNPIETDPSVKVLTRGSVLERVQQYERAPSSTGSWGSSSPLSTSCSLDSFFDYEDADQAAVFSRSSSDSSLDSNEAELTIKTPTKSSGSPISSKQAQYKSRVSSIQQKQQQQQPFTPIIDPLIAYRSSSSSSISSPGVASAQQQRRLSLRRRSSVALGRSSTTSLIPKFYHPNGKPNTYEIEIQKRNIVACFDKLPERKAQLSGANAVTSRKQFHQIALACGYSEYFKVPLHTYVNEKLLTDPKLTKLAMGSATDNQRQRKSSTVALNTNGNASYISSSRQLNKATSVDSGAMSASISVEKNRQICKPPLASTITSLTSGEKNEIVSVNCEQFLACWRELISCAFDNAAQFVHLLTLGRRNYLMPDDLVALVQSIIDDHPGLSFLRAAPDFHMRYIQTVIARIYFCINRSWTGKITIQELRKSNLLAVLQVLSQEDDINQITDFFSYEHFYVIYCKFWNLDQDHDLFIGKEDLARHNDAAISSRIIERIFSGIVSKQIQKTGKMSYSDFVWFLIAEEDKKHPRSIEYWFRLMDLDGDGYISMYEMEYFYYEQTKRLELMNIEALPFLDSACQILDLVNPREKNKISLADLKRTKMATIFFDTFINLEKYLEHESREFVSTRDVIQGGVVISDWDKYASDEYENLVTEESAV